MRVLVVARTKMYGDRVCVGAIELETGRSVRLLGSDKDNLHQEHEIRPGAVWDLQYEPRQDLRAPHVEDVVVGRGRLVERVSDLRSAILDVWEPWRGELEETFDGRLATTDRGTAFVQEDHPLPSSSTGFWIATRPATLSGDHRNRYWFAGAGAIRSVKYTGMTWPTDTIPAGALVRLSLARWAEFPPGVGELRCYLQLSAWYG